MLGSSKAVEVGFLETLAIAGVVLEVPDPEPANGDDVAGFEEVPQYQALVSFFKEVDQAYEKLLKVRRTWIYEEDLDRFERPALREPEQLARFFERINDAYWEIESLADCAWGMVSS
jgi:hypothetical protein